MSWNNYFILYGLQPLLLCNYSVDWVNCLTWQNQKEKLCWNLKNFCKIPTAWISFKLGFRWRSCGNHKDIRKSFKLGFRRRSCGNHKDIRKSFKLVGIRFQTKKLWESQRHSKKLQAKLQTKKLWESQRHPEKLQARFQMKKLLGITKEDIRKVSVT